MTVEQFKFELHALTGWAVAMYSKKVKEQHEKLIKAFEYEKNKNSEKK